MKELIRNTLMAASFLMMAATAIAQSNEKKSEPTATQKQAEKTQPAPKNDATKEAEKSLERAAESIQRSAERIKAVVETKADKIAKNSQPAIESFLVASSNLIEKIALELEKMVNEKPAKKSD